MLTEELMTDAQIFAQFSQLLKLYNFRQPITASYGISFHYTINARFIWGNLIKVKLRSLLQLLICIIAYSFLLCI